MARVDFDIEKYSFDPTDRTLKRPLKNRLFIQLSIYYTNDNGPPLRMDLGLQELISLWSMELRTSDQTRFFSSRYRSNPFRPPDVLGASNQDFDHVSEQAQTFKAIEVEKRRSLKIGPSLRSEGEIDGRTIHRENFTEDIPRNVERTFLVRGARDANIQPNGGIEDSPSEYDHKYIVFGIIERTKPLPNWYKWDNVRSPFGTDGKDPERPS